MVAFCVRPFLPFTGYCFGATVIAALLLCSRGQLSISSIVSRSCVYFEGDEAALTSFISTSSGGYYIKLAQTSVGAGDLPEDYTHLFQTLLDRVPPRQFEVIRGVLNNGPSVVC